MLDQNDGDAVAPRPLHEELVDEGDFAVSQPRGRLVEQDQFWPAGEALATSSIF